MKETEELISPQINFHLILHNENIWKEIDENPSTKLINKINKGINIKFSPLKFYITLNKENLYHNKFCQTRFGHKKIFFSFPWLINSKRRKVAAKIHDEEIYLAISNNQATNSNLFLFSNP